MTHDPFCGRSRGLIYQFTPCQCDFIAKVRADTLNMAAQAVKAVPIDGPWIESEAHESAIHQAVVAINALRGES